MNYLGPIKRSEIPDDVFLRRQWIKYQLKIRGYSLVALAKEEGVTKQQPGTALRVSYPKWEFIIAQKLGTQPKLLWPERYDKYGIPLKKMGRPKKSNALSLDNTISQKDHKAKKLNGEDGDA